MKYLALLLVIVVSLFAFGCTASEGSPQSSPGTGVQGQVQSNQTGLSGMSYAQLLALGQPVECTVTVNATQGVQSLYHAYIKSGNSRIESTVTFENQTMNSLGVYKDHVVYMQVTPQQRTPGMNCDWMTFAANETQQPSEQQGASEAELENLPSTSLVCNYASFGDEKFATPGTTCDVQQMMQQAPNVTPSMGAGEGLNLSIDAETLATVCSSPNLTARDKATLGCP